MGNLFSGSKINVKVSDKRGVEIDQIFDLAASEKVRKIVKSRWKRPFNENAEVSDSQILSAKELWMQILAGSFTSKIYTTRRHGTETFLEFFIRKLYTGLTELDRSYYAIYPEDSKRQMKLVTAMMDSVFFFASNGRVTIMPKKMNSERSLFGGCVGAPVSPTQEEVPSISEDINEELYRLKLFHVAQTHFVRGVIHKQYITMCIAVVKNFKFCCGEKLTEDQENDWIALFSCMLKKLIPVIIAYEIVNSLTDPFEGSYSHSRTDDDDSAFVVARLNASNEEALAVAASIREELSAPSGRYEDL